MAISIEHVLAAEIRLKNAMEVQESLAQSLTDPEAVELHKLCSEEMERLTAEYKRLEEQYRHQQGSLVSLLA